MDFGRTTVKTTIYSHDGQNDRIVIFDHEAAKMGEISRRDTFKTTGVMFWIEILSPGQKFGNLTYFVAPQNVIPGSGHKTVKKTESKLVRFPNFCPGERILLRNMTPVVSKVSLLEISPIFAAPRPKISIRSF